MSNEPGPSLTDIVDAHVHVWTRDVDRYPLAAGFTLEDFIVPSFTTEELAEHGRGSGVTRFNLVQMTWYGLDHSYIADAIAADPAHFVGTGIVPAITDVALAAPERAMRALAEQGMYAFRLRGRALEPLPGGSGRWMDQSSYTEMFAAGARHNLALSFLMNPPDIPEIDRMCALHPDTPVIVDHIGRIGGGGRIDEDDVRALCALSRRPRVMVKIGAFYGLGERKAPYTDLLPLIRRVIDAFGPARCMWESDSPLQVVPPHDYAGSVAPIRDLAGFLSANDRYELMVGTAERFFFRR